MSSELVKDLKEQRDAMDRYEREVLNKRVWIIGNHGPMWFESSSTSLINYFRSQREQREMAPGPIREQGMEL